MHQRFHVALFVGAASAMLGSAQALGAGTIGFEGLAPSGGVVNVNPASPYFEKGFEFGPSNGEAAVFDATAGIDMPGNSDSSFFGWDETNFINLAMQDKSPFTLNELLIGPSSLAGGPTTIALSLFFADGSDDTIVYENLSTATLVTPNASNLVAVVFTSTDDAAMDNLSVTPKFARLVASYFMNDTLAAEEPGVLPLLAVDPLSLSGFRTEEVFGTNRTVYRFDGSTDPAEQAGLVFDSSGLLDPSNYSVELVFSFDVSGGWRRIVDVLGRSDDSGFYVDPESKLDVYPVSAGSTLFTAPAYHHVVLTVSRLSRAGTSGATTVQAFLDGQLEFTTLTPLMEISPEQQVALFLDNDQGTSQQEFSDGSISVARFYQGALTPPEVLALYESFVPPPSLPEDLNHDCAVNTLDLVIMLQHFGQSGVGHDQGDLNGDGQVNTLDLIALLRVFGVVCT